MTAPAPLPRVLPSRLASRPRLREVRFRFASTGALTRALARVRREPWVVACRADAGRGELWVRLAGGFHVEPPGALGTPAAGGCAG
jgi:hypothetical protein